MADSTPQLSPRSQEEEKQSSSQPPAATPPARWRDLAEQAIEEAMRSGAFDDLPGRGKPLNLINNPFAPGTELAYQLLKDNQYTLPWISERISLLSRIQALRDEIASFWQLYRGEYSGAVDDSRRLGLAQQWSELVSSWQAHIIELNKDVAALNLKQPGDQLEILKLTLASELDRVGASRALG